MPPFELSDAELSALVSYITSPARAINYPFEEIKKSYRPLRGEGKNYEIKELKNLTVAVDKAGEIYVLESERLLDRFPFRNVHGGVKFSPKNESFFVPARDGWVISYSWREKKPTAKVRACVYLRNIALAPDESLLVAGCVLPKKLVFLSPKLEPLGEVELPGRPSAVYTLFTKDALIVAYRDKALVSIITKEGRKDYRVETPLEDFFIDPFEEFVIGSSRKDKKLVVYSLGDFRKVYEVKTESLPHLFAVSFFYNDGKFYFSTRHTDGSVSVWEMYNWRLLKSFPLQERGFFVRTHFKNPNLWVDTQKSYAILINKKSLRTEKRNFKRGAFTHVEFSGDGRLAYLSLLGEGLVIEDAYRAREVARYGLKHPAGKYNIVLKNRSLLPAGLGYEVYMEKCWGCHHTTREAFGPPLSRVAKERPLSLILAQIADPERTHKLLGYTSGAMPKIELSSKEMLALRYFIEALRDGWID